MMKNTLLLLLALPAFLPAEAAFVCGSEIYVDHVSGNTYRLHADVYTKLSTGHPQLVIEWGAGTADTMSPGPGMDLPGAGLTQYSVEAMHTFPAAGHYEIRFTIKNWRDGIINIVDAVNQAYTAKAVVEISPFMGPNRFSGFNHNMLAGVFTGNHYSLDLSVTDPDGDSIVTEQQVVSELTPPTLYQMPSAWGGTEYIAANEYHFDGISHPGIYAVSFVTKEYRAGLLIGSHVRELTFAYADPASVNGIPENHLLKWIFPNPAGSFITVSTLTQETITVTDASGKRVMQGMSNATMDVSHLQPGLYLVRTASGSCARFIRQ